MTQQQKEETKTKKSSYNAFSHIIDKSIVNFFVGLAVTAAIVISVMLSLAGINYRGMLALFLFLIVALGIAYAFGGIGIVAGYSKQEGYKVSMFSAFGASIVSSFAYMFPILFMEVILNFLVFFLPRYSSILKAYIPVPTFSRLLLIKKFCDPSVVEICFWNSQFGRLSSQIIDAFTLCVGLAVAFSVINCIVTFFKVSSSKAK